MKTTMTALFLGLFTVAALADTVPDGRFKGTGLWKSLKETGGYEVTAELQGNVMDSQYVMADGSIQKLKVEREALAQGFFNLKMSGQKVGQGYCLDGAIVCHYEIETPGVYVEETMTVQGDNLYRFGHKKIQGTEEVFWQENLRKE